MISVALRDGGTKAVVAASTEPGLDQLTWSEVDYEGDLLDDPLGRTNEGMQDAALVDMNPWPYKMPNHAWVDYDSRHEGIAIQLATMDPVTDAVATVPSEETYLWQSTPDPTRQRDQVTGRRASMAEVQAAVPIPSDWIHYPITNQSGGTRLGDELSLAWDGRSGGRHRLIMPDNDLWTPFDSTKPDRYEVISGLEVEGLERFSIGNDGHYILHLRPRTWYHQIIMLAHFAWITPFAIVPDDQLFIHTFWHRPPFAPYRHDVIHSSQTANIPDFWGVMRSLDTGLNYQWSHNRTSSALRTEVINAAWVGLSTVYAFLGNEMPTDDLFREPPKARQIVAGLTRVDGSGASSTVWLRQTVDLDAEYPRTLIGQYIYPWYV